MKKTLFIIFALVLTAALYGCKPATPPEPQAGLPNPIVEVEDASDFEKLGVSIDAPEGATDVRYSIISDKLAQVDFTLDGASYTYRAAITEDEEEDISGVYETFDEESAISVDGLDWYAIIVIKSNEAGKGALASWQYLPAQFTLYTPDSVDSETITNLATLLAEKAYRSQQAAAAPVQ